MSHSPFSPAAWAPYGRTLLRRLRKAEADDSFNAALDADGDVIAPPKGGGSPSAIDLLDEITRNRGQGACDEAGANGPALFIAPEKLLLALRLAASFGSEPSFLTTLRPRAITVVEGFAPDQLEDAARLIGRLQLPDGWAAQMRAPKAQATKVLQLIRPVDNGSRKLHDQAFANAEHEILAALVRQHPLMILLPADAPLSATLRRVLPRALPLAPVDREIILALLAQTHAGTDRTQVAPLLPSDAALANLDTPCLFAALREPNAVAAARALGTYLATPTGASDLTLEQLGGASPAHLAAADIVADLTAWRRGEAQWADLSQSLLLSGEPGVGKSLLARAVAASANVPLIESAFGVWQSAGHLGDMLREMRASFSEAIKQKPSVLFIDEIDAVGSRQGDDRHGAAYRRNVINQFLAEIDRLNREEGVVLIGATNHPHSLDPAIRRPGRFDRHCLLSRPSQAQIQHMLRRALPGDGAGDLAALARAFTGETPALIDAQIRAAKSAARRAGTPFDAARVLAQLPVSRPGRDRFERRIALHECGHAIAAALLGAGPIHRFQLSQDGGATHRPPRSAKAAPPSSPMN